MARSHHRKKHKEHLREFKDRQDINYTSVKSKTKASSIFAIAGALVGFAVSYFATQGAIIWVASATIVGAVAGYFIGKKIDS